MKLKKVKINKYKSFLQEQNVDIEDKTTRLVGKNESGKTSFLEALAKFNYFEEDTEKEFNETFDFPKNELKSYQKKKDQVEVVECTFELLPYQLEEIEKDLGKGVFLSKEITVSVKYGSKLKSFGYVKSDEKKFLRNILKNYSIYEVSLKELEKTNKIKEAVALCEGNEDCQEILEELNEIIEKSMEWNEPLNGYIVSQYLRGWIPKFWYFDEYYSIPSRISISKMKAQQIDATFTKEEFNTAKALFDLANIEIDELNDADSFEAFISELEATSNEITDKFLEYWTTNQNLEIKFEIEPITTFDPSNRTIIRQDKILNIRIRNTKHRVSLPLKNRSKGFIWFFSFLVWFSRIESEKNDSFILLLDEPGLNLHASAQKDLLTFIDNELSENYQVIYTTHSPFMIDSTKLHEVRTVYDSLDAKKGSLISSAIQEKDSETLFPLQAALGYDIAQNLYISKNNLLVEGPADLIYITVMSSLLESIGRTSLTDVATIVPVGGLDKVSTFISLLRGSKLNIVCLLDSFTDQKGKRKVENMISQKIVKEKNIRFFDEFADIEGTYADIEDLFEKEEYLKLFNDAFEEYEDISIEQLGSNENQILKQINKKIGKSHFNHFRPANKLARMGVDSKFFTEQTLARFENMFKEINKLF
ncbi:MULTISPECIES: ATP-dependent endonuclease [Exiguobacterium]|uniref:AAA family ATPase n=1 Tax=Exiguobacterium acetylicum TaxID=41170 RepID=A0ABX8GEM7_EXIAC|nr:MULTISPECIES: AAA family ATPase [Exiguobacterium]QWB31881.1 AAA family ATPase [Exiguobacterium acetylicum]